MSTNLPAYGPSRFILINSAKYGYGEIIVNKPVQLIGSNNVGKTALINALQFLLIDDERQMSFTSKMRENRHWPVSPLQPLGWPSDCLFWMNITHLP